MYKLQLLPNEAKLVEAMKKGNDVPAAAQIIGITREAAYYLLKRLVRMGVMKRTGHKKGYQHEVKDIHYEVVERRSRPKVEEVVEHDPLIQKAFAIKLDEEQMYYLKQHRQVKRSILARRLGITRLQLNFILMRLGNKG